MTDEWAAWTPMHSTVTLFTQCATDYVWYRRRTLAHSSLIRLRILYTWRVATLLLGTSVPAGNAKLLCCSHGISQRLTQADINQKAPGGSCEHLTSYNSPTGTCVCNNIRRNPQWPQARPSPVCRRSGAGSLHHLYHLTFYVTFQVVWPHNPYWSRPHLSGIFLPGNTPDHHTTWRAASTSRLQV